MGKKAKAAGQFFGGILNNPFVALLLLGLGTILIFRGDIRKGFAGIGEGFGNIDIQLPSFDFKFPDFDFKFPEIKLPEFNFPDFSDIFAGFQSQLSSIAGQVVDLQGSQVTIPPDTMIDAETGIVTSETPPTIVSTTGMDDPSLLFGQLRPKVFDQLQSLFGLSPAQAFGELKNVTTIQGLGDLLNKFNEAAIKSAAPMIDIEVPQDPQPFSQPLPAGFEGGGISFIGGSIFETPIANLSLSQIIDKFNVTASQAANILAIAKDDFGGFDFGTNTGSGIGSVFQDPFLTSVLPSGNVSDPQFQGLSATEIANLLTGGNIQNF